MPNITLSVPNELMKRMKLFREMKWSEVARQAIEQRINDLEEIERLASKSKLSQKDAEKLGKKIKRSAALRFNANSAR
ncbi:MAG: hypothetical protein ACOC1P_05180 [Minisyncoccales bacterium]